MAAAKVLIVENDRHVLRDIQLKLTRIGYEVRGVAARDGGAFFRALKDGPDLVIMGVPSDGDLEATAAARSIRELCNRPVVFFAVEDPITGDCVPDLAVTLHRPFEPAQLHTAIQLTLGKHAAGQSPHPVAGTISTRRTVATDPPLWFRRFCLVPGLRELLRDGKPVQIGSRAFDLLWALLRSRGTIVEKSEILRCVWPSTIVEESSLRFQMATLRKILAEDRELIKTIPGRGYLFAAEVDFGGVTQQANSAAAIDGISANENERQKRDVEQSADFIS